jgi:uncharacterized Zn finger protein (UPF0148 family)
MNNKEHIHCPTCGDVKHYYYNQRAFCADCEDDIGNIKELIEQNKIMREALKKIYKTEDHNSWSKWVAYNTSHLRRLALEALEECEEIENEQK